MRGTVLTREIRIRTFGRAKTAALPRPGWMGAGVLALLCSWVAWGSLPRAVDAPAAVQQQWRALGVAPISAGGITGMPMAPAETVVRVDLVPKREAPAVVYAVMLKPVDVPAGPTRIRWRRADRYYYDL